MASSKLRWMAVPTVLFLLFATAAFVTSAAPAYADSSPTPRRVSMEMVRVGVDHEIAEANGYEVRVDRNGVEYAVPKGSPPGLDNTVEGPCGLSWVDWVDIDWFNHRTSIYTGFEIWSNWPKAVSVPTWQSAITDNYGVSHKEHGPILDVIKPAHVWVGKRISFTAGGPTGAWVDITFGVAVLANGTICFSLNPWDYTDL